MDVLIAREYSGIVRDAFTRAGHNAMSCDILPTESPGLHYQGDVRRVLDMGWDLMIAHPPCTYLSSSGLHWNKRGALVDGRPRAEMTEEALEFVRLLMAANIPRIALENPIGCIGTRIDAKAEYGFQTTKATQTVQPWQYGHDASKATCLWLKGLPALEWDIGNIVPPRGWEKVMGAADMLECEVCCEPFCPEHHEHYADCDCIGPTEEGVETATAGGVLFGTRLAPAPRMRWANQTDSGQNRLPPTADRWKIRSTTYSGIADAMAQQWGTI